MLFGGQMGRYALPLAASVFQGLRGVLRDIFLWVARLFNHSVCWSKAKWAGLSNVSILSERWSAAEETGAEAEKEVGGTDNAGTT
jgi:hypothetical protein